MTSTDPTEAEEMSGRVLEIIGAYRMGAALDARNLYLKATPGAPPPEPVEGYIRDGVYYLARRPLRRPDRSGRAPARARHTTR